MRDLNPHRLMAAIFGAFRLVLLAIREYYFVVRTKNRLKITCHQV